MVAWQLKRRFRHGMVAYLTLIHHKMARLIDHDVSGLTADGEQW